MFRFCGRSRGRPVLVPLCILLWCASAAAGGPRLTLAEVQRLAVQHQPLLEGQSALVAAARERAVSAGQLPDPQLKLGVLNLPVDSADAWRFNRDSMTQSSVGLAQEFTLAGKRRLRAESESLNAAAGDAQFGAMTRAVQRDAGLAYLDLLHPHHAAELVRQQIAEAQRALAATEIAYRSGRRGLADVLAARAAIGMLQDKAAGYAQATAAARENLQRWTGGSPGELPEAAPEEPELPPLPPLAALLGELDRHPEAVAAQRLVDRAAVMARLARKAAQPDFNVEVDYAYRAEYSNMVSVQVGIPLPMFAARRQDRDIAAAQSELDAEQSVRDDLRRRLAAELSSMYRDWEALGGRIDRYGSDVVPPLDGRAEAALAEYRSGNGSFTGVLDARQALLEAQLSLLELRLQRMRTALKLHYFVSGR